MGEKMFQLFTILILTIIGISCALSIYAHYRVWRYAPRQERLDRPPQS